MARLAIRKSVNIFSDTQASYLIGMASIVDTQPSYVSGGTEVVKFGVIGDSNTDSFHSDDVRGGTYNATTFNPIEALISIRDFNLGTWGTYAEPRRTDYRL